MTEVRLILWGLSGVIIDDEALYADMVADVCADLLGVEVARPELAGYTDPQALRQTLAAHGAAEAELPALIGAGLPALNQELMARRSEFAARGRTRGSAEVITQLKHRQQAVPVGLLTGRSRANAAVLAELAGVDRYLDLDLGGYGDEAEDRADLLAVACARIGRRYAQQSIPPLVLVTDQTQDIAAAVTRGCHTVAVSSDSGRRSKLTAAGARQTLTDLTDVPAAVAAILD